MKDEENKYIIADNIQYYMDAQQKSRQDLVKALNLKYTTLANWLQGTRYPRIDMVEKLAKYFGVTKADLIEKREEDIKMGYPRRLANVIHNKGVSITDLSLKTGIEEARIVEFLEGVATPSAKATLSMANALGINPNVLRFSASERRNFRREFDRHRTSAQMRLHSTLRGIPLIRTVVPGENLFKKDHVEGYEYIDSKYNDDGFEYFALRVSGHSMEPTIQDGDIVIVRQQDTVDSGQIAIVLVAGEDATAKEVRIDKSGVTLVGHNLAVYTPQFYTNAQVVDLPVTIIGLVIEVRHKLI